MASTAIQAPSLPDWALLLLLLLLLRRHGAPDAAATSGWGFSSAGAPTAFQESGCPLLQTLCAYAAPHDLLIVRGAAQPSYGCVAIS